MSSLNLIGLISTWYFHIFQLKINHVTSNNINISCLPNKIRTLLYIYAYDAKQVLKPLEYKFAFSLSYFLTTAYYNYYYYITIIIKNENSSRKPDLRAGTPNDSVLIDGMHFIMKFVRKGNAMKGKIFIWFSDFFYPYNSFFLFLFFG